MSEDNRELNIKLISISDYLVIVALKYVCYNIVYSMQAVVFMRQEAVLKPVVSYHTRLTPCSTDFYFLCCPLQKLQNAFLAVTPSRCEFVCSAQSSGLISPNVKWCNMCLLCLVLVDQEDHSEASQPATASDDESGTETQVMHHSHAAEMSVGLLAACWAISIIYS